MEQQEKYQETITQKVFNMQVKIPIKLVNWKSILLRARHHDVMEAINKRARCVFPSNWWTLYSRPYCRQG
jgi:hypothetical protein